MSEQANIAVLHYHLNRGGVTQVIQSQLRSLDAAGADGAPMRAAIVYGGRKQNWPDDFPARLHNTRLSMLEVPGIDYADAQPPSPLLLAEEIETSLAAAGFLAEETLIHAHNHALGKNPALPGALQLLAGRGYRLLLQVHDFAEDFRSQNYRQLARAAGCDTPSDIAAAAFPQAPQIHYAVLNRRDFLALSRSGVAEERLHWLPNPVPDFADLPDKLPSRVRLFDRFGVPKTCKFVLYPVRGIRRKNVAEMLLWAAAARGGACFGITLPPLNPREASVYQACRQLAAEIDLPCRFDIGTGDVSFPENLAAADVIFNSSVAEGFGMVFLEAWLAGRPLAGRDLPEITADFVEGGLEYPWLLPKIAVPLEWIGHDAFCRRLAEQYKAVLHDYSQAVPSDAQLQAQCAELIDGGHVDFAALDLPWQLDVIRGVAHDAGRAAHFQQANQAAAEAFFSDLSQAGETRQLIARNADCLRRQWAIEPSGHRLRDIYQRVMSSPCGAGERLSHGERILETFLDLRRFSPVRLAT